MHVLRVQRSTRAAAPGHGFVRAVVLEDLREEIEALLEQDLILIERESKQRERLGEGAAAEYDFGATVRDGIERREALKDAHRLIGAQDRHCRSESNALRLAGDRGEDHLGRR